MAGLIARLFGGGARPPDPDPLPGQGGYQLPPGPSGATGFPGSTSQTRTFRGASPRAAKLRSDTNSGWENGLSSAAQVRQASSRGDTAGASTASPRATPDVATPQPQIAYGMQSNSTAEFFGGPALHTGPGNQTAGGVPLSRAAAAGGHSQQDTQTPATQRQPQIGLNVPGAQNVRNQVAERYKNPPGQLHTYQSAARPDQAPVNPGGQATDGNVRPGAVSSPVTVPSRFVFAGGGNQTWGALRQMPYTGRGDGARGADLNGQRYYAQGQSDQFFNAGQGDYGIARQYGGKRPVGFTEPAPWTQNFYDTTDSVGTTDNPGSPGQAASMVYVSPSTGRATNSTGRKG